MSLELCVLGSGSSGNSTVVRSPGGVFLIDAGFGPRTTEQRMHGIGLKVEDVAAIVLTHLDHDHFNWNWLRTIVKQRIRVFCAKARVKELLKSPEVRDLNMKMDAKKVPGFGKLGPGIWDVRFADLVEGFEESFEPMEHVRISAMSLAHDEEGSHGFVMECHGYRVGFATDLGHVPEVLIERFCGVDVLALESNYDPEMERTSSRPWYLKERVMGGKGHLSNDQALAAIRSILDKTAETCGADRLPRHIVLLHRSRECNCPKLVKRMFTRDPRISPVLTLADQFERTGWLHAGRPRAAGAEQLALAFA